MENEKNVEVGLQDKKPSVKLAQARRVFNDEKPPMFIVMSMVDTIRFEIGQRLTKAQVQELLDDGTVKVTVNAEK